MFGNELKTSNLLYKAANGHKAPPVKLRFSRLNSPQWPVLNGLGKPKTSQLHYKASDESGAAPVKSRFSRLESPQWLAPNGWE